MAEITDFIAQTGGLQPMARELGISESQAAAGAAALLPAILGGFKKQAQSQPAGLSGLSVLFDELGGGGLLDDVAAAHPTNIDRGNTVLREVFGSKDVSRAVAQNASAKTGLDPKLLEKMLPMLAMLAVGYLSRQRSAPDALPGAGTHGGLASMIDMEVDANPLDDILRKSGEYFR